MSTNDLIELKHKQYEEKVIDTLNRLKQGESLSSICKEYHFDRNSYSDYLDKHGYRTKKRHYNLYSESILKTAYIEYLNGEKTISCIAKELNVNRKKLSKDLKYKYNLVVLHDGKKQIDDSYFNIVNTKEKAYWLGFLFADGYNDTIRHAVELCLQDADKSHIEKFKNAIQSKHKISKRTIKGFINWRIYFRSKQISTSLHKYGCVKNKSFIMKFPLINKKLIPHFIRGYFDGDGCVYTPARRKISVSFTSGSESFLISLQQILYNYKIISHVRKIRLKNNWTLSFSSKKSIYNFYNLIYKNTTDNIRLTRKFDKYSKLVLNNYFCRPESTP
jgi:hypothetical protein